MLFRNIILCSSPLHCPCTASCHIECTKCDEAGCCTACSPGYQTDNCTCTKSETYNGSLACWWCLLQFLALKTILIVLAVVMLTVSPTPSPFCGDLEGCLTCALGLSGGVCCSGCDDQNGFTLNDCKCSRGEYQYQLIKNSLLLYTSKMH